MRQKGCAKCAHLRRHARISAFLPSVNGAEIHIGVAKPLVSRNGINPYMRMHAMFIAFAGRLAMIA